MSEFYDDLAKWVHGVCDERERERRLVEDTRRRESEIAWLRLKIASLEPVVAKRPSTVRQIRELSHQMRQCELEIAFSLDRWTPSPKRP